MIEAFSSNFTGSLWWYVYNEISIVAIFNIRLVAWRVFPFILRIRSKNWWNTFIISLVLSSWLALKACFNIFLLAAHHILPFPTFNSVLDTEWNQRWSSSLVLNKHKSWDRRKPLGTEWKCCFKMVYLWFHYCTFSSNS